jgi:hypothetical protein
MSPTLLEQLQTIGLPLRPSAPHSSPQGTLDRTCQTHRKIFCDLHHNCERNESLRELIYMRGESRIHSLLR